MVESSFLHTMDELVTSIWEPLGPSEITAVRRLFMFLLSYYAAF